MSETNQNSKRGFRWRRSLLSALFSLIGLVVVTLAYINHRQQIIIRHLEAKGFELYPVPMIDLPSEEWPILRWLPEYYATIQITDSEGNCTDDDLKLISELYSYCKGFLVDKSLRNAFASLEIRSDLISDCGWRHLRQFNDLDCLIICSNQMNDSRISHFTGLQKIRRLGLKSNSITDAGLCGLNRLIALKSLSLNCPLITTKGIDEIVRLKDLTNLDLDGCEVTDAEVQRLGTLSKLHFLSLNNTSISDASVPVLIGMKLNDLRVDSTKISDAGRAKLKAASIRLEPPLCSFIEG